MTFPLNDVSWPRTRHEPSSLGADEQQLEIWNIENPRYMSSAPLVQAIMKSFDEAWGWLVFVFSLFVILMLIPFLLHVSGTQPKFIFAFSSAFLFLVRSVYERSIGTRLGSKILWILGFLLIVLADIFQAFD
jgi:hypothetical protein